MSRSRSPSLFPAPLLPAFSRLDSVRDLKRAIYIVALPVVAVLGFVTWWFERELGIMPISNMVGLPLVSALALVMSVLLWFRRDVRVLELAYVVIGGTYLLVTLYVSSSEAFHTDQQGFELLARLGYWFPPYFMLVFLVFGTRAGVIVSSGILLLAVFPGLGHFRNPSGHMPEELLLLAQMYISMALVILLLGVLSAIARMQARHALAMESAANTDALTGLSNRRHLEMLIDEEIARAERYGHGLSLILFDLDHFKRVNDEHGHAVGDRVLRGIHDLFRVHIRQVDTLGRWGGEEFVVLTPEMAKGQALALAERLRGVIERHTFEGVGRLTASFGVGEYSEGDSVLSLTRRADEALYSAKQGGRNLVVAGD